MALSAAADLRGPQGLVLARPAMQAGRSPAGGTRPSIPSGVGQERAPSAGSHTADGAGGRTTTGRDWGGQSAIPSPAATWPRDPTLQVPQSRREAAPPRKGVPTGRGPQRGHRRKDEATQMPPNLKPPFPRPHQLPRPPLCPECRARSERQHTQSHTPPNTPCLLHLTLCVSPPARPRLITGPWPVAFQPTWQKVAS